MQLFIAVESDMVASLGEWLSLLSASIARVCVLEYGRRLRTLYEGSLPPNISQEMGNDHDDELVSTLADGLGWALHWLEAQEEEGARGKHLLIMHRGCAVDSKQRAWRAPDPRPLVELLGRLGELKVSISWIGHEESIQSKLILPSSGWGEEVRVQREIIPWRRIRVEEAKEVIIVTPLFESLSAANHLALGALVAVGTPAWSKIAAITEWYQVIEVSGNGLATHLRQKQAAGVMRDGAIPLVIAPSNLLPGRDQNISALYLGRL